MFEVSIGHVYLVFNRTTLLIQTLLTVVVRLAIQSNFQFLDGIAIYPWWMGFTL